MAVMAACLSCSCLQMNGQGQMVVMVVMVDMSYFKVNFDFYFSFLWYCTDRSE